MKLKDKFIKLNKADRLYELDIPIIALTGGIATGKSTAAQFFLQKGIPLLDADKLVKIVYQKEAVKEYLQKKFPQVIEGNSINFKSLRSLFFSDLEVKKEIENLIYSYLPEVFRQELERLESPSFVLYDIPLLFEKNLEHKFDVNILVYATPEIQIQRLMSRDQHTREEAVNIISHQISIDEKKKRADFILDNGKDPRFLEDQIVALINCLTKM